MNKLKFITVNERNNVNKTYKKIKLALVFFLLVTFIFPVYSIPLFAEEMAVVSSGRADRITLELQGVNIFDVFKIFSKKSGLNIVAGKNVQGQVSIFLQDVPVREALRTILQSQGLAGVEERGIIRVISDEEYIRKFGKPYEDKRETRAFQLQYASAENVSTKLMDRKSVYGRIVVEPRTNTLIVTEIPEVLTEMEQLILQTDQDQQRSVFKLKYIRVADLESKLKAFMEGGNGHLEIDERSNRFVVFDIPARVERIESLVDAFDVKKSQVLIEAKIVEVRLSDSYRKGIDWQRIIDEVGNVNTLRAVAPLAVSPPAGASALATLSLGDTTDDLQVVIDLLERVGKTNLLSNPRILVMDNEEAQLAVATREPFVSQTVVQTTTSTNTADNVQFVDVGVTMKVKPRIAHSQFVEMDIKPEISSSNRSLELEGVSQGSNTTFTRTRIPVVTTQQLETMVQIKSGHTLIIGGLIQDQQERQHSQVPFISAVPLLGRFFRSTVKDYSKTELVIFLTPVIIDQSENNQELDRYVNPDGKVKDLENFGEYPLDLYKGKTRRRNRPYWQETQPLRSEEAFDEN